MTSERVIKYKAFIRRKYIVIVVLVSLLLLSAYLSLSLGSSSIGQRDIFQALFFDSTRAAETIVWSVRMPRIVVGIAVGAALALSGVVMQNVLSNPMASASTLGVSQGASFGAAFAICFLNAGVQVNSGGASSSIAITNPYMVTICAFIGGMLTTIAILMLSRMRGATPSSMILSGVAISSMFTGALTLIQYFADDVMVSTIVYWTFGSLGRAGWNEILLIFVLTIAAFIFFIMNRWNYNALEGGRNSAKSLGVNVDALQFISLLLCALISSVSVAFVGCISFVGLIAPHVMRRFVGSDYRFLIPTSALAGSILLLLSDTLSRTIISPIVLPIGALTSFLGAPLFLYLVIRRRGKDD